MKALLHPFWGKPDLNFYLLLSSLFIHILGLSSAIFIMLIYSRYLSHGLDSTLYTLSSGVILAIVMEVLLRRARFQIISSLCVIESRKHSEKVRHKLLNANSGALQLSLAQSSEPPAVSLEKINTVLSPTPILALLDLPFALLFIIVLFILSWQLGLCALIIVGILIMMLILGSLKMKALAKNQLETQGHFHRSLKSTEFTETIRTNNAQSWLTERINHESGQYRIARHNVQQQQDKMQAQIRSTTMFLSVLIIAIGARLSIAGEFDFGMLIAANILASRLIALISQPIQQLPSWLNAIQAFTELTLFDKLPEETQGGTQLVEYQGRIAIKQLAFSYPQSALPVFERLNIELEAGEILIVVGSNGSGKTTLARLIAGLITPDRGSILVDGVDLRQIDAHWWRRQLVYLPQDPDFLQGSLRENLSLLKPEFEDQALINVLRQVDLGHWVEQHPEGLDLTLQMGGRNLSLGIRRRIAFARALLTDGKLVLIDEPLEGLDQSGIQMMQKIILDLKQQKRTIIIISQFMQAVEDGSKVLNLDAQHDMQIVASSTGHSSGETAK